MTARAWVLALGLALATPAHARRAPSLVDAAAAGPLALERAARALGPKKVAEELAAEAPARRKAALAAVLLLDVPGRVLPAVAALLAAPATPEDERVAAADVIVRVARVLDAEAIEVGELGGELQRACATCATLRASSQDPAARELGLRCAVALARLTAPADATRLIAGAVTEPTLTRVALDLAVPGVAAEQELLTALAGGPEPALAATAALALCDGAPRGRPDPTLIARLKTIPPKSLAKDDAARLARCVKGGARARR